MNRYSRMIQRAYADGCRVNPGEFQEITYAQAVETQQEVLQARKLAPGGFKILVRPSDGLPVVAPMASDVCVQSGQMLKTGRGTILGFEVEMAVILKRDITMQMARDGIEAVIEAVDHVVFGLEILQTRFDDHHAAGPNGQLADNLNNGGYVFGTEAWHGSIEPDGLAIHANVNGKVVFDGSAVHPSRHPLLPIIRYALENEDPMGALKAGARLTTGALCGVLPLAPFSAIAVTIAGTHELRAEVMQG